MSGWQRSLVCSPDVTNRTSVFPLAETHRQVMKFTGKQQGWEWLLSGAKLQGSNLTASNSPSSCVHRKRHAGMRTVTLAGRTGPGVPRPTNRPSQFYGQLTLDKDASITSLLSPGPLAAQPLCSPGEETQLPVDRGLQGRARAALGLGSVGRVLAYVARSGGACLCSYHSGSDNSKIKSLRSPLATCGV